MRVGFFTKLKLVFGSYDPKSVANHAKLYDICARSTFCLKYVIKRPHYVIPLEASTLAKAIDGHFQNCQDKKTKNKFITSIVTRFDGLLKYSARTKKKKQSVSLEEKISGMLFALKNSEIVKTILKSGSKISTQLQDFALKNSNGSNETAAYLLGIPHFRQSSALMAAKILKERICGSVAVESSLDLVFKYIYDPNYHQFLAAESLKDNDLLSQTLTYLNKNYFNNSNSVNTILIHFGNAFISMIVKNITNKKIHKTLGYDFVNDEHIKRVLLNNDLIKLMNSEKNQSLATQFFQHEKVKRVIDNFQTFEKRIFDQNYKNVVSLQDIAVQFTPERKLVKVGGSQSLLIPQLNLSGVSTPYEGEAYDHTDLFSKCLRSKNFAQAYLLDIAEKNPPTANELKDAFKIAANQEDSFITSNIKPIIKLVQLAKEKSNLSNKELQEQVEIIIKKLRKLSKEASSNGFILSALSANDTDFLQNLLEKPRAKSQPLASTQSALSIDERLEQAGDSLEEIEKQLKRISF